MIMQRYELPMFPLGTPLVPEAVLPLQIFEPRYVEMLERCLQSSEPDFGVVLIERGHEVGGGDIRAMIGCATRILQISDVQDGRRGVLTLGVRRIRIEHWLPDDPFPLAMVSDLPDEESGDIDQTQIDRLRAHLLVLAELAGGGTESIQELADLELSCEPSRLSYQLSTLAPIGAADRQRLLVCASPQIRLDALESILGDVEAVFRFALLPD
jgi:uncharacterized protein